MEKIESEMKTFLEAIQKDFDERQKRIENIRTDYNLLMHDFINTKYDNLKYDTFCDIIDKSSCSEMFCTHRRDIDRDVEIYIFKCGVYDLYIKYGINTYELIKWDDEDEDILSFSFHYICYYINKLKEKELKVNKN